MRLPLNSVIREAVSLKDMTTMRVGGSADFVVCPRNTAEVCEILGVINREGRQWFPLGRGSNVLASDEGYRGVIIHFNRYMSQISFERGLVICEAGADTKAVCDYMLLCGMSGGEFLACIPSSVGGAAVNNSGCFGQDMSQVVEYVLAVNGGGNARVFSGGELSFGYRDSFFKRNREWVVCEVGFRFKGRNAGSAEMIRDMKARKRLSQPLEQCSAGCIFKEAEGVSAGKRIDEMGFKGFRVGGAVVSEKHANFIVNPERKASCEDVLKLISIIAEKAKMLYNVTLKTEIDYLPVNLVF